RFSLASRRPGVEVPGPHPLPALGEGMHSAPPVQKYVFIGVALLAFTGITVAANKFHFAVPLAITVALIIALAKGSMVATVFMHLSHERKRTYGALLLTLAFF